MERVFDILIVGAGMAGASLAAQMSGSARVCLLEMEPQPGYHSTGRSAAVFSENYGPAPIRALTRASRAFFESPPTGFADTPLLQSRKVLQIVSDGAELETCLEGIPPAERDILNPKQALALCPILRPEAFSAAILQRRPADIEVHALHQGYLRQVRANGSILRLDLAVREVDRAGDFWSLKTMEGVYRAPILVNAAGAWAGQIAEMAGGVSVDLRPLKRTVCLLDPPEDLSVGGWPMVKDGREQFYLKPDAGKLLLSPCDESPSPPSDVQAEELDIAVAVDRVEQATTLQVRRISHRWAGLRSFAADRLPIVGFDSAQPTLFWLAALGGYGIQTAPALSLLAAGVLRGAPLSPDLESLSAMLGSLSPQRFVSSPSSHLVQ